jgi:hypothetical protein
MALIGEQFDETEEICGIVASVRQRGDKLALWTRTASNEAVQVNFRSPLQFILFITMLWSNINNWENSFMLSILGKFS